LKSRLDVELDQKAPEAELIKEYGQRAAKALNIAREHRVKRYKDFDIVVGHNDEYIIEGKSCTCNDFLYALSSKGKKCSHIIAIEIADTEDLVDNIDSWYQDVRELL
jgi:predicted nucleic acid-binding Zn finger protein